MVELSLAEQKKQITICGKAATIFFGLAGRVGKTSAVQRLAKNKHGYLGETIDIAAVLKKCVAAAQDHGWTTEGIHVPANRDLFAFTRLTSRGTQQAKRIYLSAGIHGDEPAGPLAVCELLQENQWPAEVDLWLCPCLNPTGFPLNRRENADGVDLNRQYLHLEAKESRAHVAWLNRQPRFDVCFCLHEDWESHGFYVYELNPDNLPSLAEVMVEGVSKICPIDPSPVIEGREAREGIIRPSADPSSRPEWPETFYLFTYKTRLSYTLEAPSDFPLTTRVSALVAGVRAALECISQGSQD